jgi:hypothetical protein
MAFSRQDSQTTGSVGSVGSSVVEDNLSDLENQSSTESTHEEKFQSAHSLAPAKSQEDVKTAAATAQVASAVHQERKMSSETPQSPQVWPSVEYTFVTAKFC